MKKTYIAPNSKCIFLTLESQLMVASDGKLNITDSETINGEGEFLSNDKGSWGNEIWDEE